MIEKPASIAEYIEAAPPSGRSHLKEVYSILKSVAPDAEEVLKWGVPFFVEPRFLFSFSGHKSHLNFAPMSATLMHFRDELAQYQTTANFLQVPYTAPVPTDLIRRIAEYRIAVLNQREDESFW